MFDISIPTRLVIATICSRVIFFCFYFISENYPVVPGIIAICIGSFGYQLIDYLVAKHRGII